MSYVMFYRGLSEVSKQQMIFLTGLHSISVFLVNVLMEHTVYKLQIKVMPINGHVFPVLYIWCCYLFSHTVLMTQLTMNTFQ